MRLRPVTPDDAPAIAAIYAPIVRETAISFEEDPPDAAAMRQRIMGFPAVRPWIVAADASALLGYAYAGDFRTRAAYRWSTETSVYVDPKAHRRGIGRALYLALFELLSAMGYRRAFAGITLPNEASVALHRALGFIEAGIYERAGYKFGRWHDVGMYQRSIGSDPARPDREPLALSELPPGVLAAALHEV